MLRLQVYPDGSMGEKWRATLRSIDALTRLDELEAMLDHRPATIADDIDELAADLVGVLTLLSDDELTMRVRLLQSSSEARSWFWNSNLARIDGLIAQTQYVFHFTRTAGAAAPSEAILGLRQGIAWVREGVELLIRLDRHLGEQRGSPGTSGLSLS